MKNKKGKDKKSIEHNYEKELQDVFGEAMKQIDPELMKTIQLIYKMNEESVNQFQIITSYSGTNLSIQNYAQ